MPYSRPIFFFVSWLALFLSYLWSSADTISFQERIETLGEIGMWASINRSGWYLYERMRIIKAKPGVSGSFFVLFLCRPEGEATGRRWPKLKLEAFENGIVVRRFFAFRKWVCVFFTEGYLKLKNDVRFLLLKDNLSFSGYFCFETL